MVCRSSSLAARMRSAAEALLDVLDPDQRRDATAPFDTADHREWTYLPGPRPGLALDQLTSQQQERVFGLLDTGLSVDGAATAREVMALDDVLRDIEQQAGRSGWRRRGSGQYWVRVLGVPGAEAPWAWRLNGHHLAVHVTLVGDGVVGTPQFFGANPAVVRSGPEAGWQVLRPEETLARALLGALDERERAAAWVSAEPPGDILTRHDPVAQPERVPRGVGHGELGGPGQAALERLVRQYVDRLVPDVAAASWSEIVDAGLDDVAFAWSGSVEPGEGHYYALTGPTFLVEYDNVQNGANHVHTVWRDLRHDWGDDLLAEHYRAVKH
jgi:hypothetical protein